MAAWKREEKFSAISAVVSVIALVGTLFSWGQSQQSLKQSEESLRISKQTLENEYNKPANLTISLGRDLFLNAKPFVGVMISIHNSGARTGVIAHGTLAFDSQKLNLVMASPEAESWTYGAKRDEIPMRFSYFSPLTIDKSSSVSSIVWFERDMGTTRLYTAGSHALDLELFNDTDPNQPIATKKFGLTLTDNNVSFIYMKGNETTQLPVPVDFKP